MDEFRQQPYHYTGFIRRRLNRKRRTGIKGLLWCVCLLCSCGIEDYPYLYPVTDSRSDSIRATIDLPIILTDSSNINAIHFVLYYRIYVSGILVVSSISQANMSAVSSALAGDYNALYPYTNRETTTGTSIGTLFSNRNYHVLALEGADIERILSDSARGEAITLDFTQHPATLEMNNAGYHLFRSNGTNTFSPVPDRYFRNTTDLSRYEYAAATINADVSGNSGVSGPRYTYVSIYIAVSGIDTNLSPIYSVPTHVGIFRLPD